MWLRVLTQNSLDLSLITKGSKVTKVQATSSSIFTAYPQLSYPANLTERRTGRTLLATALIDHFSFAIKH